MRRTGNSPVLFSMNAPIVWQRYAFVSQGFNAVKCVLCDKVYKLRIPKGAYRGAYPLVHAQLRAANLRDQDNHYRKAHPEVVKVNDLIKVDKETAQKIDSKRGKL